MISVSPRAAAEVRRAAEAAGTPGQALRLAAKQAEDGSVVFGMGFDEERRSDELLELLGVTLLVSSHSRALLEGMMLDFVPDASGTPAFVLVPIDAGPASEGEAGGTPG